MTFRIRDHSASAEFVGVWTRLQTPARTTRLPPQPHGSQRRGGEPGSRPRRSTQGPASAPARARQGRRGLAYDWAGGCRHPGPTRRPIVRPFAPFSPICVLPRSRAWRRQPREEWWASHRDRTCPRSARGWRPLAMRLPAPGLLQLPKQPPGLEPHAAGVRGRHARSAGVEGLHGCGRGFDSHSTSPLLSVVSRFHLRILLASPAPDRSGASSTISTRPSYLSP